MNGTLQSQKYKSRNSFISILQLNALKKTVKSIKHESAKLHNLWEGLCITKNYDAKCLRE